MVTESAQISLPDKLKAVLARLCEQLGPITRTKAVKLPYLVDVVANQVLGHAILQPARDEPDGSFRHPPLCDA